MSEHCFTHFIAVGACYIDTILTVPEYPPEDTKQRASSLSKRRGGNCPNTLEVLQQLYAPQPPHDGNGSSNSTSHQPSPELILLSALPSPSSPDTQFILDSLFSTTHPVDLTHAFHRATPTAASSYIVQSQSTHTRTIVNYNAVPEMTVPEFQSAITSIITTTTTKSQRPKMRTWVHFEGRIPEITIQCIDWLRSLPSGLLRGGGGDVTVSVECEKPNRPGLEELAERADVVFHSRSWAEGKEFASAREFLVAEGKRIRARRRRMEIDPDKNGNGNGNEKVVLCCTWGALGASAVEVGFGTGAVEEEDGFFDSEEVVTKLAWVPESRELRVVDTIGAGDTWIAGMVFGFLSRPNWGLEKRVVVANELAGRKIERDGFGGLGEEMYESLL